MKKNGEIMKDSSKQRDGRVGEIREKYRVKTFARACQQTGFVHRGLFGWCLREAHERNQKRSQEQMRAFYEGFERWVFFAFVQ